jgi:hypothetical protein
MRRRDTRGQSRRRQQAIRCEFDAKHAGPRDDRIRTWTRVGEHCRAALSAVGVGLLVAALAACGSGGSSRPPGTGGVLRGQISGLKPGENPAGQQLTGKRRGGTLTVYSSLDFDYLDPGQTYYQPTFAVMYATQRPLFAYLPNTYSTPSPDMAAFMPTVSNGGDHRRRKDGDSAHPRECPLQPAGEPCRHLRGHCLCDRAGSEPRASQTPISYGISGRQPRLRSRVRRAPSTRADPFLGFRPRTAARSSST